MHLSLLFSLTHSDRIISQITINYSNSTHCHTFEPSYDCIHLALSIIYPTDKARDKIGHFLHSVEDDCVARLHLPNLMKRDGNILLASDGSVSKLRLFPILFILFPFLLLRFKFPFLKGTKSSAAAAE